VITDNRFPYWVYGGQQESGSAGVASRGNDGQITSRDWHTVGVEEYGYVAPDPLNPDIIFGGKVQKYDRRTGQVQDVAPEAVRGGAYRFLRTAPIVFSTVDKKALYLGANVLFKTTTGGHSWDIISPDLTRPSPEVPESIGVYRTPAMAKQPRRGVIYAVAPSYVNKATIWAGTDDGLIHVTRDDGKTWADVTPPGLTAWSKVSVIDAGRFDDSTAYAAINRIRLDDQKPYIFRTHNGGKTWKPIVRGLPENAPVNSVREDPIRKGLLFAGTERAVYVSFNDGDDWQSLRQNMPATSIRDLVIHEADVVVGTHGRSFWILDDISPLRQLTAATAMSDAVLFAPAAAYLVKRNVATDTPLPPDEPTSPNPPDGAVIDYRLKHKATGQVTLEILDSKKKLVRRFTSTDSVAPVDPSTLEIDPRWVRPSVSLPVGAGSHRFVWDLHYPPLDGSPRNYPISAVYRDTPAEPTGPAVLPGKYTVRLTVEGKVFEQPLVIKMDPRVTTAVEGLEQRFALSMQCYEGLKEIQTTLTRMRDIRKQLENVRAKARDLATAIDAVEAKIAAIEGARLGRSRGVSEKREASLSQAAGELRRLFGILQGADAAPTTQAVARVTAVRKELSELLSQWTSITEKDLADLNAKLKAINLPAIDITGK
jgi:hypothetical protein